MAEKHTHAFRMIGHAHIDPVWRWTKSEGIAEVLATFQSAMARLHEFPDVMFVASSAQFYEWVQQFDPPLFAEIIKMVASGRWNLVGGWWVEADVNVPNGESLVRQGLYAQHFFVHHFGQKAMCGFSPDTFGHPNSLPQILSGQDLPVYFFMRPDPSEKNDLPGLIFNWQSMDGSRVLTFQILDSYSGEENDIEPRMKIYEHYKPLPYSVFYGVGNHGGGPTITTIKKIQALIKKNPQIAFSSLNDYICEIRNLNVTWPVVTDDLHNHSRGCYSACSEIKQLVRQAESTLLVAEKISVMAAMVLPSFVTPSLTAGWKKVLFNQFHDILCGTSIESAYDDSRRELYSSIGDATEALTTSCGLIALHIDTLCFAGQASPIVVFNPNSFSVKEWLEVEVQRVIRDINPQLIDSDGGSIPYQEIHTAGVHVPERIRIVFQAELPACGYRTYALDFDHPASMRSAGVRVTDTILENDHLRVGFNQETGFLSSVFHKAGLREYLSGPAALPLVLQDTDDTWGHKTLRYDQVIGRFLKTECTILERGPERGRLLVTYRYGDSLLRQEFILTSDSDFVDVRVTIDWREPCAMVKLAFPTVLSEGSATFSTPYGFIERSMSGEEQTGQTWIDISGQDDRGCFGFSLLNDCKYGYSVLPGEIRLTVLHSPIWSHHQPQVALPEDGYRHMEQGVHSFVYRMAPHVGDWRTARITQEAWAFVQKPALALTHRHPGDLAANGSAAETSSQQVVITAMKPAESGDGYIIRCLEMVGQEADVKIVLPFLQRSISAHFRPCEIKTYHIPGDALKSVVQVNLLEEPLFDELNK